MPLQGNPAHQFKAIIRGASEIIPNEPALMGLLEKRIRLNVKFGIDPRSDVLHLGHLVPVICLRVFKELNHNIVLVKGGFTARFGDPLGQDGGPSDGYEIRTASQVENLAQLYNRKMSRILGPVTFENNATWFNPMTVPTLVELLSKITLSDLENRSFIQTRRAKKAAIYIPELLYPVFQAYDSVVKKIDIEIGGTDQRANIILGRRLQEIHGQPPQVGIIYPLLPGTDGGLKMSVVYKNYISLDEDAPSIFGKIMSIPDSCIEQYTSLLTQSSDEEIAEIHKLVKAGQGLEAKMRLARSVCAWFHSSEDILGAEKEFNRVVRQKKPPTQMANVPCRSGDLVDALMLSHLAGTKSEAKRLILAQAVKVNGAVARLKTPLADKDVLNVRRHYVRIQLGKVEGGS